MFFLGGGRGGGGGGIFSHLRVILQFHRHFPLILQNKTSQWNLTANVSVKYPDLPNVV